MMWKQWYISRRKFNAKFKVISKYFGKVGRQRDHKAPNYLSGKRSRFEYYQQKIVGRRRDRSKAKHVQLAQERIESRKTKKALTKNPRWSKLGDTIYTSIKPKINYITTDTAQLMRFHLKNKTESHLAIISQGSLGRTYKFSLFPWTDTIFINSKNFLIRYYNQQIFIYNTSGKNRPSKQSLVYKSSTLNENQIDFGRSPPINQPTPIVQKNRNTSKKKKPSPQKPTKPKQLSQRSHGKPTTKH